MRYVAKLTTEDGRWLVEFPDCPGCQTFGETREEAIAMAREALEGWLEAHLEYGDAPPRPVPHRGVAIPVRPRLDVAIQLRWLREDLRMTQRELAAQLGVSQQQIAKLENPEGNPTIGTLEAIASKAGAQLVVRVGYERSGVRKATMRTKRKAPAGTVRSETVNRTRRAGTR
ncbi:MAG: type II toxin-antitoxin system HicB family antitoxin [Deltaproteobacteria bacterium]|nr:MAG: type II toxin-antitoxin system HicB family antitoxin [Deltaproteobacteria bacterium]TMQ10973.1 MAG: type II toxin-antitoxin system HicB family antitoxin [Deltaproteobacteria bacterium]